MEIKGLAKKLQDKIMPYAVAGVLVFTGCTATNQNTIRGHYPSERKAMKVLEVDNSFSLEYLDGGYIILRGLEEHLMTLAGVYAGTAKVRVRRTTISNDEGEEISKVIYTVEGFYDKETHPEAMRRVLRESDTDRNRIITEDEFKILGRKIFERYAKIPSD